MKKSYEFKGRELNLLDKDLAKASPKIKLDLPPHALAFLSKQSLVLASFCFLNLPLSSLANYLIAVTFALAKPYLTFLKL